MKKITLLTISLVISAMLLTSLGLQHGFAIAPANEITQAGTPWYHRDWRYRRPVFIENPCGSAETDYQVQINLNGTNFDFANAEADGSDLLVTNDDGTTLIPFWIESWDSGGETAILWVKLPELPTDGSTINLYYGNSSPPSPPNVDVPPTGTWNKSSTYINPSGDPGGGIGRLAENIVYDSTSGSYWLVFATTSTSVGLIWSDNPADPSAWTWSGIIMSNASAPHLMEYSGAWYLFYSNHSTTPVTIDFATAANITGPYTPQGTLLSPSFPWEGSRVDAPFVFQRGDSTWVMLYMGVDAGGGHRTGYATSTAITGTYTTYSGNPALDYGPDDTIDEGITANPWAVELDGTTYIGYTASNSGSSPWNTAYATTTDWTTFIKRGVTLPLGPPGAWDEGTAFRGAVSRFGDTYYFPYSTYMSSNYRMGIATAPATMLINSPELVFDFYDGFDGTTLSTNWTVVYNGSGHAINVSGGLLTLTANGGGYQRLWGAPIVGPGNLLEIYASHLDAGLNPNGGNVDTAAEFGYSGVGSFINYIRIMDYPHQTLYTIGGRAGGSSTQQTTSMSYDSGWHTYTISRTRDSTAGFQVDSYTPEYLGSTYVPTIQIQPWIMNYAASNVPQSRLILDWIRQRQYCGSDPTVTIRGYSDIQETQDIGGTGTFDFTWVGITLDVGTQGSLSSLQAVLYQHNHPDATTPIQTGRYWELNPTGTGYNVDLTLPHNSVPDNLDKNCRHLGAGQNWDCVMSSFDPLGGTITRGNITQLSDWATGNNVGPTVLTLTGITVSSRSGWILPVLITLIILILVGVLFKMLHHRMRMTH
jgi:hypothetical protein